MAHQAQISHTAVWETHNAFLPGQKLTAAKIDYYWEGIFFNILNHHIHTNVSASGGNIIKA